MVGKKLLTTLMDQDMNVLYIQEKMMVTWVTNIQEGLKNIKEVTYKK